MGKYETFKFNLCQNSVTGHFCIEVSFNLTTIKFTAQHAVLLDDRMITCFSKP
jgi:hypothetical protein